MKYRSSYLSQVIGRTSCETYKFLGASSRGTCSVLHLKTLPVLFKTILNEVPLQNSWINGVIFAAPFLFITLNKKNHITCRVIRIFS